MKRFIPAAAVAAFACAQPLAAQQQPGNGQNSTADQNRKDGEKSRIPRTTVAFWKAELPGGSFVVARNAISAISLQQYILDGAARVTEVNISIAGDFRPRFYYIEPLAATAVQALPGGQAAADHAQVVGQGAVNRVIPGDPIWAKVVKNYPTTTHAGTIEFRLETKDQLDKLYESVERAWISGKSEVYTPDGAQPYQTGKKSDDQDASSSDADATGAVGGATN
ncbi:MAG: hypothetical protein PHC88_14935 [Terrimicrobiaceae bacterium]|nr:hypothetical protein [Terrimicrobiaceae bacterium]